jgi:hypothetical protein
MTQFIGNLSGSGQGSDFGFTLNVTIQGDLQMILHENSAGKIHGSYSYHATETVSGSFLSFVDQVSGYGNVHGHGSKLILTETDPAGLFSIGTATIHGGTITYAENWSIHDGGFSASGEASATLTGHKLTPDSTESVGSFAVGGHGGTSVELTHLDAANLLGHHL